MHLSKPSAQNLQPIGKQRFSKKTLTFRGSSTGGIASAPRTRVVRAMRVVFILARGLAEKKWI